jgi:hypothetical protein
MRSPARSAVATLPLAAAAAFAAVALLPLGCGTRSDPRFNAHRAPATHPALLQRADGAVDAVGHALDNLDRRMENAVY